MLKKKSNIINSIFNIFIYMIYFLSSKEAKLIDHDSEGHNYVTFRSEMILIILKKISFKNKKNENIHDDLIIECNHFDF